ncbi:MAG: leucine-rich repeat protein, partial [Bacilli bacterium]|nr:leucine-rich repeat protein [Bacilli bacterium]
EAERRKQEEARLAEEKRRKEQEAADAKRKAEEEAKRQISQKPQMQTLSCPHCGGYGDYDVNTGIFSCRYCGYKGLLKKEAPKKEVPQKEEPKKEAPPPAPQPAPAPKKSRNQLFQEQYKKQMVEAAEKRKAYKPGMYIRFGSYPQTADTSIANLLKSDGRKTEDGFHYLPIAWRIFKCVSGVRPYALLISDRVLDAGTYSQIGDLLQGQQPDSFIQKAFSSEERRYLLPFGKDAKVALLGNEAQKDAFDLLKASGDLIADWTPYSQPKAIHDPDIDLQKAHGANYWLEERWVVGEQGEKLPYNQNAGKFSRGFRPMISVELSYLVARNIEPTTHSEIRMSETALESELANSWGALVETGAKAYSSAFPGKLVAIFGRLPSTIALPEGITSCGELVKHLVGRKEDDTPFPVTKLILPNSLTSVSRMIFLPVQKAYEVHADHPLFTSENGVLYDKKKTKIIAVPVKYDAETPFPASVVAIGPRAFCDCKLEKALKFPPNLKTIEEEAFRGTSFSGDVRLPSGLQTVGREAFSFASFKLDGSSSRSGSLFIPATVKKAESQAFKCWRPKAICLEMRKPLFGLPKGFAKDVFGDTPEEKIIWGYTPKKLADLDEKQKEQMRKDLLENLERLKKK